MLRADGIAGRLSDTRLVLGRDSNTTRVLGKIGKSLELGAERIEATVAHEARHEDRIDPLVDKRRHVAQKQLRCKAALIDEKTVARFERAAIRRRIEHDLEPKLCKEGSPRYAVAVVQKRAGCRCA